MEFDDVVAVRWHGDERVGDTDVHLRDVVHHLVDGLENAKVRIQVQQQQV